MVIRGAGEEAFASGSISGFCSIKPPEGAPRMSGGLIASCALEARLKPIATAIAAACTGCGAAVAACCDLCIRQVRHPARLFERPHTRELSFKGNYARLNTFSPARTRV